jgi:hypothetical protein
LRLTRHLPDSIWRRCRWRVSRAGSAGDVRPDYSSRSGVVAGGQPSSWYSRAVGDQQPAADADGGDLAVGDGAVAGGAADAEQLRGGGDAHGGWLGCLVDGSGCGHGVLLVIGAVLG